MHGDRSAGDLAAVGRRDPVGDRESDRVDVAERVLDRPGRDDPAGGPDQVRDVIDEPEVAVDVAAEQVAGLQPRVPGLEDPAQDPVARGRDRVGPDAGGAAVAGGALWVTTPSRNAVARLRL